MSDTGIGISESDQRIIFEEFAQVDSSMQRRVKGTGLGLPFVRKLAELLGGFVGPQFGWPRFYICINVPTNYEGSAPPVDIAIPELDTSRKIILIVEDNPETAFVYSRYLTNAGFQSHAVLVRSMRRRSL